MPKATSNKVIRQRQLWQMLGTVVRNRVNLEAFIYMRPDLIELSILERAAYSQAANLTYDIELRIRKELQELKNKV